MSESGEPVTDPKPKKRRSWGLRIFLWLVLVPWGLFALYLWAMLSYSYSRGERSGYVQKISLKGWVCKTWEGELAMANLPGAMPEVFAFSVRDAAVAHEIERLAGQRVALTYEEHVGLPTTCFGETGHFVTAIRRIENP